MIIETFGERAAVVICGDWNDDGNPPEDAVIVQRDAFSAIVITQRERQIVLNAAMARELAKVLVREAKAIEADEATT